MHQALYVLFGAVFTVAVALALGRMLLRRLTSGLYHEEELGLGFVAGSAVLSFIVFLLLATRLAYKGVFLALGFAVLIAAFRTGAWRNTAPRFQPMARYLNITLGWCFSIFTALYFITAMAPECSPDGSTYHLGFVSRYVRAHSFVVVPYNMYGQLSEGIEMLFVHAFAFGRHSSAALVHYSFLLALTLLILSYGRRIGHPAAGVAAALFIYTSPVVGMDGTSAYVDVAVACILFAIFYLLQVWDERRMTGFLMLAGLLAGFAYAAKYTAFLAVPYAAGFVLWRTRRFRPAAVVVLCSLILITPWVGKNLLVTGNPVSPMMNRWFPNSFVHISMEREWAAALASYGIPSYWQIPWNLTVKGNYVSGQIGPLFLLIPLVLLTLRTTQGRRLLVPALLYSSTYLTNIGARFFIPPLPYFALAIALAFATYPRVLTGLVWITSIACWPAVLQTYAGRDTWALSAKFPLASALRVETEDHWLGRKHPDYVVARVIEANTPPDARIFGFDGWPEAYSTRDYALSFQSARGQVLTEIFFAAFLEDYLPNMRHVFRFPKQTVRAVRMVQTASAGQPTDEWAVNEVRLMADGKEIPRSPEWRIQAKPNPWDVQLAFDNSPVTRWRTWEPLKPGDYIEVNLFPAHEMDEVDLELNAGQPFTQVHIEVMDERGAWRSATDKKQDVVIQSPGFQGKAAMAEIKARGFDYLLLGTQEMGGKEALENPPAWGLSVAGRVGDLVLYRIDVPGPVYAQ